VFFQALEDEEHRLLKCSNYEDIRARYMGLFITGQNVSLENVSKRHQALIANYVKCQEIHDKSSVN
jgi:hypothetical protein